MNKTLKIYFELLEVETDPGVLMTLLYAIGHNNSELSQEQIEKMCSFIDYDNSLVKEGLVSALLGIDNILAIETLVRLSSDKRSHIRNWATFGLGSQIERNNKLIREALWERINDKHPETKLEAIAGLAKRKDKRINDIIERELTNGEFGTLLFEAIIDTSDKAFLPLLKKHLKAIKGDKTINWEWEKALKHCINELTELTDK